MIYVFLSVSITHASRDHFFVLFCLTFVKFCLFVMFVSLFDFCHLFVTLFILTILLFMVNSSHFCQLFVYTLEFTSSTNYKLKKWQKQGKLKTELNQFVLQNPLLGFYFFHCFVQFNFVVFQLGQFLMFYFDPLIFT